MYAIYKLDPTILPFSNFKFLIPLYIYIVMGGIITMELIRKYKYEDDTFFIMHFERLPQHCLQFIKKYSYPNVKTKNLLKRTISYYLFPFFINLKCKYEEGQHLKKQSTI